jgi:hypothetical protein
MAFALDLVGQNPTNTSTTPEQKIGSISQFENGRYMYVKASAAVAQYACVKIDDDYTIAELTTAISGAEPTKVGVAQVSFAAPVVVNGVTVYTHGWVFIGPGSCSVLVAASCVADVKIGTTTTAGVIDDTYTDLVQGIKLTTNNGGAQAATAAYAACELSTNQQD